MQNISLFNITVISFNYGLNTASKMITYIDQGSFIHGTDVPDNSLQ